MNQHQHKHKHAASKKGLHKDWRAWIAVLLMLAAMLAYVMSMDEAIQPGEPGEVQPMPAAE
jgi:hypothetical protein